MAELNEVAIILKRLASAYGGSTVTEAQARAYHAVLGKHNRIVLAQVAIAAVAECKFFPRAAELVAIVNRGGHTVGDEWRAWHAPNDPFDEHCMWAGYKNGTDDPYSLTEADIEAAYRAAEAMAYV